LIAQQDVTDQEKGSKFEETLSKIYNLTFEEFAHEFSKASDQPNVIEEEIDTMRSTVDNTAFNQQSSDREEVIEEIETDGNLRESYKEKSSEEYTRIVHDISNPSLIYYQSIEGDLEEEYEENEKEIEDQEEYLEEDAVEGIDQLGEDTEDVDYDTESNQSSSVENRTSDYIGDTDEYNHDQSFESECKYDTLSNHTSDPHPQIFDVRRSLNSDALKSTAHFNKAPSSIPPQERTVTAPTKLSKSHENFFTFGENKLKQQIPTEISPRPSTQGVSELTSSSEPEETAEEEKSSHLLIIEYDNAQTKNKKLQVQHQKILKRDEELAKRHQDLQNIRDSPSIPAPKKRESPLVPRIKESKKVSDSIPKEPIKQIDRSPFLKQDVQESPKEEIKAQLDQKYRRHKNLPNLVYPKHSNKNLIKNAICQVCLAGEPNKKHREELVEVIHNNPDVSYFVILFKGELTRWDLQGLYEHDVSNQILKKTYGKSSAPEVITPGMVQIYYRYNSGTKEFKPLACKTITTTVDAVSLKTLHKH
jgi:hypothetical protein